MGIVEFINPLYVLSGFVVGGIVGLAGVGGGALMTPVLILVFGVHPAAAVGTDLLYAGITKTGGVLVHAFHRAVEWRIVGLLALGSVPMAILTLTVLHAIGTGSGAANLLISKGVGVALAFTALALVFRNTLVRVYSARVGTLEESRTRNLTVAAGAILGVLVTISSVGAGALGVTALILLYPNLATPRIIGSDIAHAVPLTFVAGAGHWMLGNIDFALLGSLLLGSIPGIVLASSLAPRAPDHVLRFALSGVLCLVSIKLLA